MEELKPCPFCGETPEIPEGIGTQYEMECECGMANSCVQISDLMTIEERLSCPKLSKENGYKYPQEYITRARDSVIAAWNTRTTGEDDGA